MSATYPCPLCHQPTQLFDAGTTTPHEFFSPHNIYAIAAGHKQRLPIYTCTKCGHGFTPLDMPSDLLVDWYKRQQPDSTFLADETARRTTARKILQRIEKYFPAKGKLLDIGAGPGIFVSEASRRGWDATALEPSNWAVSYGRNNFHINMLQADISTLQTMPPASYDVITIFDVIEHVIHPVDLITAATALLKPNGLIVILAPKFDSLAARVMGKKWHCVFPAHIHYFTEASLTKTLQSAGLTVVQQKSHTRYLSAQYLWQRIVGQKAVDSNTKRQTSIPINIGDEFEVYAQKG